MHERISYLIKTLGLKKVEFSKRLNISQPFVSELCSGKTNPSDRTIADICREFNVSEVWLRTGEGEMFLKVDEDQELQNIFAQITISNDDLIKRIIKSYWALDDTEKAVIQKLVAGFTKKAAPEG